MHVVFNITVEQTCSSITATLNPDALEIIRPPSFDAQ